MTKKKPPKYDEDYISILNLIAINLLQNSLEAFIKSLWARKTSQDFNGENFIKKLDFSLNVATEQTIAPPRKKI